MKQFKTLYFDIETSPCHAWVWNTGKQYISHQQLLSSSTIICITWIWDNETEAKSLHWDKHQNDKTMLQKFRAVADKADVLVAHNGKSFDVKHINTRIAYHQLEPLAISTLEDTLLSARKTLRLPSFSLDYICKYFNLGCKIKTEIDLWLDVWLRNDRKRLKEMVEYGKHDAVLLKAASNRLKSYLPIKRNLAILNEDSRICPKCGELLWKWDKRVIGLRLVQRYKCSKCRSMAIVGNNSIVATPTYPR